MVQRSEVSYIVSFTYHGTIEIPGVNQMTLMRRHAVLTFSVNFMNLIKRMVADVAIVAMLLASVPVNVPAQVDGPVSIVGGAYYKTPSEAFQNAKDGDRIEVRAGTYNDVGTIKANNVTVVGVGGRPRIDGKDKISEGRGIWMIYGDNTTLDNFEFVNEDNGKRGHDAWDQAAIYLRGNTLAMRNMYVHNNMQGFFNETKAAKTCNLTVENSIFEHNGDGGGHSHNLYVNHNISKLTMRGVWSRDCNGGHILKVRAHESDIQACMFTDRDGISLGWFLDFPNGGDHKFVGNIVVRRSTKGSFLLTYGEDKFDNPAPHRMLIAQNTFVNDGNGQFFNIRHIAAQSRQNILVGPIPDDEKDEVGRNQVVDQSKLKDPRNHDYRIAEPNRGSVRYASYAFEPPAGSISRSDSDYGGYAGTNSQR